MLILVLVLSIGLVVSVYTAGAVAVDDERAGAAGYLDAHADDETVLSRWGAHRLYNYHASGAGRSYRLSADYYATVVGGERTPPNIVGWIVVARGELPSGYADDWHVETATLAWQQGDICIYELNLSSVEEVNELRHRMRQHSVTEQIVRTRRAPTGESRLIETGSRGCPGQMCSHRWI